MAETETKVYLKNNYRERSQERKDREEHGSRSRTRSPHPLLKGVVP